MDIIPNPTPEQVNNLTQKESDKSSQQQTTTDISQTNANVINKNTPPSLQPQGADKLAIVLNKNRSKITSIFIPILVGIAAEIGIKNIGTPQMQLPNTCLSQIELNRIINKRNQLVNRLNNIVKTTDALSKILAGVSLTIGILTTLLSKIKSSRRALNITMSAFPGGQAGTPGRLPATINNLKDVEETTNEKLVKATGAVASASLALALINAVLLKIIAMLNSIDAYLKKCSPDSSLTSLSSTLLEIERMNKEVKQDDSQTYNGFILEIIEEPYSPTVTRRKAVAKNKEGIILLSTPLTFSTENQVLLDEIKLLIDTNNLKAD